MVSRQGCRAIIAVKARAECKTRLRAVLGPAAREQLARDMLEHVLATAHATPGIDEVMVVSPERDEIKAGITVIQDDGRDLNGAFAAAREHALAGGQCPLLFLPADLPSLRMEDLVALIAAGQDSGVAIATDRAGTGTNALYLTRSAGFPFSFGADSRRLHEAAARARGHAACVVTRAGLQLDIDTSEDYLEAFA